jgi:hypothetical protein
LPRCGDARHAGPASDRRRTGLAGPRARANPSNGKEPLPPQHVLPTNAFRLWRTNMGRGMLLWLIGIPLPIILLIWLFGGLN